MSQGLQAAGNTGGSVPFLSPNAGLFRILWNTYCVKSLATINREIDAADKCWALEEEIGSRSEEKRERGKKWPWISLYMVAIKDTVRINLSAELTPEKPKGVCKLEEAGCRICFLLPYL